MAVVDGVKLTSHTIPIRRGPCGSWLASPTGFALLYQSWLYPTVNTVPGAGRWLVLVLLRINWLYCG